MNQNKRVLKSRVDYLQLALVLNTVATAMEQVKFLQIRSISNYVETRNRENWNIPLAIQNLNQVLTEMLQALAG